MSSWRECKLGDVATFSQGIQVPLEEQQTEIFENSVRFIRIVDFTKGGENEIRYIKNPGERYLVNSDDLVMIRYGSQTAGKIARGFNGAIANNTFKITPEENVLNKNFLYYFLSQKSIFDFFHYSQASSTMPAITFGMIGNLDLDIPPLEEQKAIAEVLSSLDDKIDLLHCQNQTLESLAQTLFRQWFIEEAKEEWEEKPLSEIALHVKNNIKPASFENKSFFHFSLPAFDNGQRATKELGSEILSNKYQVIKNSILVSKLNPRTPRIWLIDESIDEDNSICSTEFQVLYPKEEIWRGFIYCFLKTEQAIQELAGASSGTSGSHQRVKPEDIFNLTFQYPDMDTLKKFDDVVSDYWRKIKVNQKQIQTLENLRDTLLPKLLSGEVRVEI